MNISFLNVHFIPVTIRAGFTPMDRSYLHCETEDTMAKKTAKGHITIDPEVCKGCYLCIEVCPQKNIRISDKLNQKGYYPAQFEQDDEKRCTACAQCATICPDVAIEVYRD